MRLGARLAALARERGLPHARLAEAMGVDEPLLARILSGEIARPPDRRIDAAARALGVSAEELRALAPADLREAAHGSYEWREEILRRALVRMVETEGGSYCFPVAIFDGSVVVRRDDGVLTRYTYKIDGEGLVARLSDPERVVETFSPAADAGMHEAARLVAGGERDPEGSRWRIRVIRAGRSANGTVYPAEVLREAAARVNGVRVLARSDEDHLRGRGRDARNIIGNLSESAYVDADGGSIEADLTLLDPAGPVGRQLAGAWRRGMTDVMGFSIDATGRVRSGAIDGRPVRIAESITEFHSVDLVLDPAAGGHIIRLIESRGDPDMPLRDRMIEAIRRALGETRLAAIDTTDDEALEGLYREAVRGPAPAQPAAPAPAPGSPLPAPAGGGPGAGAPAGGATLSPADVDARIAASMRLAEARRTAEGAIAASGLPAPAQARLRRRLAEGAIPPGAEGDAIRAEREYLAEVAPGG